MLYCIKNTVRFAIKFGGTSNWPRKSFSEMGLKGIGRVEARLPRLELAFEYHFFVKINVFEDEWYNFYTHFDHFYPGAHMF